MASIIRKTCLFVLALGLFGIAQATDRNHDITIDDYFTQAHILGCAMSPDGGSVAYFERRWQGPKEPSNIDLWLVDCKSKEVQRLTFDAAKDDNPVWSPDSKSIYFTSNPRREGEKSPPYNGKNQVWRLEPGSSRLVPITKAAGGVEQFRLSRDGKTLYYMTSRDDTTGDWKDLKEKFSDLNYGHDVRKLSEVWKLDLSSFRETKVVDDNRTIKLFDVSADEKRIAMVTTPDELDISFEGQSRVDIFDVASSKISTLPDNLWRADGPSPYGWFEGLAWSDSGRHLAFVVMWDGYPSQIYTATWDSDSLRMRQLARPKDVFANGPVVWRGNTDELCFMGDDHATKKVFVYKGIGTDKSAAAAFSVGDVVVDAVSFSANGERMAVLQTGQTYARDIFVGPAKEGDCERLTNINPQVDTWKLPKLSRVSWKGANGDTVEGILELPPGHDGSSKLPTIVSIHGGPTGADYLAFQYWIYGRTQFSAKDYAVFCPNYRGSTGYGDKFLIDLVGRENDIEVEDIMKGVDALIEKGIADPDRLGVMGWSNGGFLTNCLITHSTRFKAASSGAGVFDMTIQWGEEDTPGHVINYMRGLPWKKPAEYQKASPLYRISDAFKTPTLIHVGENDPRVPVTHSKALHRALHYYAKVPVELVTYPRAGHGLTEYKHRLAKMKWDQAWFDKYVRDAKK